MTQDVSVQLSSRARFVVGFLLAWEWSAPIYGVMISPERDLAQPSAQWLLHHVRGRIGDVLSGHATGHRRSLVGEFAEST